MWCITRQDMVFGDIIIPARTKCEVISNPRTKTVDAPGVRIALLVENYDIGLGDTFDDANSARMYGFAVNTNTTHVYMDAGDQFYRGGEIYGSQAKKVLGDDFDKFSERLFSSSSQREIMLMNLTSYLEDKFSDWVLNNCDFHKLTEEEAEEYKGFAAGDSVLSEYGRKDFEKKKLEYQNKLEIIGFTYDFRGGLLWED